MAHESGEIPVIVSNSDSHPSNPGRKISRRTVLKGVQVLGEGLAVVLGANELLAHSKNQNSPIKNWFNAAISLGRNQQVDNPVPLQSKDSTTQKVEEINPNRFIENQIPTVNKPFIYDTADILRSYPYQGSSSLNPNALSETQQEGVNIELSDPKLLVIFHEFVNPQDQVNTIPVITVGLHAAESMGLSSDQLVVTVEQQNGEKVLMTMSSSQLSEKIEEQNIDTANFIMREDGQREKVATLFVLEEGDAPPRFNTPDMQPPILRLPKGSIRDLKSVNISYQKDGKDLVTLQEQHKEQLPTKRW